MKARVATAISVVTLALGTSVGGGDAEPAAAQPTPANTWVKLDRAALGKRGHMPLIYDPALERFLVPGGGISWPEYKKPHPFDVLALDLATGQWENWFPKGKAWGPRFGDCTPPGWKSEYWTLTDLEGSVRPNLVAAGGMRLYDQYACNPDDGKVYFYARGSTFSYDPAARVWRDLAPDADPCGGTGNPALLWGSMCYLPTIKKIVLFGGGNVLSERGDPGTWTYDPAANVWAQLDLDTQPPQRANSQLVYDPISKKVVLFGGDQLNQLLSDTWTFDGARWEERQPAVCPSPRGGHALLWLPGARKVLLLGGYALSASYGYYPRQYRIPPLEAWTYDTAANRWEFIRRWEKQAAPPNCFDRFLRAAASDADTVLVVSTGGWMSGTKAGETWLCRMDVSTPDPAGTAKFGVKPGTVERRTGCYDPGWYETVAPPADPAKVAADLAALEPNTWTRRPAPNRPKMDVGWGSAVFSPERDLIMRFSGGHCYYSGTAPQVYDVKTNRWSIPFAPELPLDYIASNSLVPGEWSFSGSPWMTGHTLKTTGYDPTTQTMVFSARRYSYFFDPRTGRWSRARTPNPFRPNAHITTLCTVPGGVAAWVEHAYYETSLWSLNAQTRTWSRLPVKVKLPAAAYDSHGLAYDSKRDRLLLLSPVDKTNKGDVFAYDMKTGEAAWLGAAGKEKAALKSRETIYIPQCDAVLVGARVPEKDGRRPWLLYDCAKNAWFGAALAGADPIPKDRTFSVDLGLMYDPNRKLVWAVDGTNHLYVLRFEPKTVGLVALE